VSEDRGGLLPGEGDRPEEGTVAGPGEPIEGAEVPHHLRAERIEADVADEFQQTGFHLHHDGPVPILEEMARAPVPAD